MIKNIFGIFIAIIVILMYTMAIYLGLHPDKYGSLQQKADSLWVLRLKR